MDNVHLNLGRGSHKVSKRNLIIASLLVTFIFVVFSIIFGYYFSLDVGPIIRGEYIESVEFDGNFAYVFASSDVASLDESEDLFLIFVVGDRRYVKRIIPGESSYVIDLNFLGINDSSLINEVGIFKSEEVNSFSIGGEDEESKGSLENQNEVYSPLSGGSEGSGGSGESGNTYDEQFSEEPEGCNDGIKNQDETGIDCGGVCDSCPNCVIDADCAYDHYCNLSSNECELSNCVVEDAYFVEDILNEQEITEIVVQGNKMCTNRSSVYVEIYDGEGELAENSPFEKYLGKPSLRLFNNDGNRTEKWAGELTGENSEEYHLVVKTVGGKFETDSITVNPGYCTLKESCSSFSDEDSCLDSGICGFNCDWKDSCIKKDSVNYFYVDPINGDDELGDGSLENPWKSITDVIDTKVECQGYDKKPRVLGSRLEMINDGAPIRGGDTIYLMNGVHNWSGRHGCYNADYITLTNAPGHSPKLNHIYLWKAKKWRISNLTISPSFIEPYSSQRMVFVESHNWHGESSHIIIENNTLFCRNDSSSWSKEDWITYACGAISGYAPNSITRYNIINNTNGWLGPVGENNIIEYNHMENIMGDGIAFGSNNMTIQYNYFKTFYGIDGNHDDAIQSHKGSNLDKIPTTDAKIIGNILIGHDPNNTNPLVHSPQGIGCFDPPYHRFTVLNNIVVVDHYHGITIYGCINCTVSGNLVKTLTGKLRPNYKIGSEGRVMTNNIGYFGNYLDNSSNLGLDYYDLDELFMNAENLNFLPKRLGPLIDSGNNSYYSKIDRRGILRPQGGGVDIGPYEFSDQCNNGIKDSNEEGIDCGGYCIRDDDSDGFYVGNCDSSLNLDCDDLNKNVNPGQEEVCSFLNEIDDNCDGNFDDSFYLDSDSDGINDCYDNCPVDSNSGQEDTDFDNLGDACDDVFEMYQDFENIYQDKITNEYNFSKKNKPNDISFRVVDGVAVVSSPSDSRAKFPFENVSVSNGLIIYHGDEEESSLIVSVGGEDWCNYNLKFTAGGKYAPGGLFLNYIDEENYYKLYLRGGSLNLSRVENGVETILPYFGDDIRLINHPSQLNYSIDVICGSDLEILINDSIGRSVRYVDTNPLTLGGNFGFFGHEGISNYNVYDNLVLSFEGAQSSNLDLISGNSIGVSGNGGFLSRFFKKLFFWK